MRDPSSSLETVVASRIAERRKLDAAIVARALRLLDEGKPVPYLARYRREDVGGLDEASLHAIRAEAEAVRGMESRREFILRAIAERGDVPDKLRRRIERCRSRTEMEYLYEPYRPPRKTPASLARERGLEPLAEAFLRNEEPAVDPFVDPGKGVASADEAVHGAREILAERFSVDPEVRGTLLRVIEKEGVISAAPAHGKTEIPGRFANLKTYEEKLARVPAHRFLALRRAEKENAVSILVQFDDEKVVGAITHRFFPKECSEPVKAFLTEAAAVAIRHARPAVTQDALQHAQERVDREAITVFRNNLHDLLLFPPAGPRRVMGVDPSPRGAIPVACVDERGQHLDHARLKFFDRDEAKVAAARERILQLAQTHKVELVAIGNGQGRRECEAFLREALAPLGDDAPAPVVVNEVGVGAYASGPVGRAELPALPVPIRGAVSLARRLMDPLPELVKVDPRQIGVGQYQSDVDSGLLTRALGDIVEHCVNYVGVDVNRAPVQQLARVCGMTTSVARALADHREKQGRLPSRAALRELPFISDQTFEYAAGFLRVPGGDDPLDATGVHPSHVPLVAKMAASLGKAPADLLGDTDVISGLNADDYADEQFGAATVAGVLVELLDGGQDPRPKLEAAPRSSGVTSAADLKRGMRLSGRVTNVTNFGAFVDVGVQQDGLVHVSELADHFVKDPTTVAHVGQVVEVRVLGVDNETGRISLSMKSERAPRGGGRDRKGGGRQPRRGRGRPPRRDQAQREEPREERVPESAAESAEPAEPAPQPSENPVPDDMTEEEFMKRKMEELRKRFS